MEEKGSTKRRKECVGKKRWGMRKRWGKRKEIVRREGKNHRWKRKRVRRERVWKEEYFRKHMAHNLYIKSVSFLLLKPCRMTCHKIGSCNRDTCLGQMKHIVSLTLMWASIINCVTRMFGPKYLDGLCSPKRSIRL